MSTLGFDTVSDCTAHGQQIIDGGYSFVGRYYDSLTQSIKTRLARAEALHLSSMGLYLISIWENSSNYLAYFNADQGTADGTACYRYAVDEIKQPYGSPNYFTVDLDPTEAQIRANIVPYFEAIRAAFTHQALAPELNGGGTFRIGVYGSGLVCRILLELGLVEFTALAQSTEWAEYAQFRASGRWNLLQGATITTPFGLSVDPLTSRGDGGGWRVG